MNVLVSLLGPPPEGTSADAWVRTLLVGGDVLLHLHEDPRGEELALSSTPGRVVWSAWPRHGLVPWWDSRPHPDHADATRALRLDPATRELHLIDRWPRHALDAVTLGQQLGTHAQLHRRWRSRLLRLAASADAPETPWRKESP